MKRFFVLVLCLSLCLSMFSFDVSAAQLTDNTWINLFNYSDLQSSVIRSTPNQSFQEISFTTTQPFHFYNFSFVFLDNVGTLDESIEYIDFYDGNDNFAYVEWELIDDDLYRVWGYFFWKSNSDNYYTIEIGCSDDYVLDINFLSFYCSLVPFDTWDIEAYLSITAPEYESTIHYVPTDQINYRMFDGGSDYADPGLTMNLWTDDWHAYDYIDYVITLCCYSVTSISCFYDGKEIPVDVSVYDNSYTGAKWFTYTIRVDQRSINRDLPVDDEDRDVHGPLVMIDAQVIPDELNVVAVDSVVGSVVADIADPDISFLSRISIFLESIDRYLKLVYSSIVSGSPDADDLNDSVDDADQQLGDLVDDMNSVTRPPMDSLDGDVSDYVSGDDLMLVAAGIDGLFESDIITSIFSMSLILCLASFVFFGKKG